MMNTRQRAARIQVAAVVSAVCLTVQAMPCGAAMILTANGQDDPKVAAAYEAVNAAMAKLSAGEPGACESLRASASRLSRAGRPADAARVLEHVIKSPESSFELMSALRMQGQYFLAAGLTDAARAAFEKQLAIVDAEPHLAASFSASVASGANQYAMLLASEGRIEEAMQVNARIIRLGVDRLGRSVIASALANNIGFLRKLGRTEAAAFAIDELFQQFPDFGRDDGRAVAMHLVRADLADAERKSDEYIVRVDAVWNDPVLGRQPESLAAGSLLVEALANAGHKDEAFDVAFEVLARIDANRARWLQSELPGIDRRLRATEMTMLSRLQNADFAGRPDLAWYALTRLREHATTPQEHRSIDIQMERVRKSMTLNVQR